MLSSLHLRLRLCVSHLSQPRVSGEAIDLQPNGPGTWRRHVVQVNPTESHCKDSTNEKNLIYSWGTPLRNLLPQICQTPGKCSFCWRPPEVRRMLKHIMNVSKLASSLLKKKSKKTTTIWSPLTFLKKSLLLSTLEVYNEDRNYVAKIVK